MDYETIKSEATDRKCKIDDLLAMAKQNDPFYLGQPRQVLQAQWFADLWKEYGKQSSHVRRFHYWLLSRPGSTWYNGDPYENTSNQWKYTCDAAKYARYLNLIPDDVIVDKRAPPPHIFARYPEFTSSPRFDVDLHDWLMPALEDGYFPLPDSVDVAGYDTSNFDQPYHIEVWCEKSTMDDVLLPLCERYRANLVTGEGEMTVTAVIELMVRLREAGRPGRIFYVSDYDPGGQSMPLSVARKIEFYVQSQGMDVRLDPVVLTEEQIEKYNLPRKPIKDEERRKATFESRRGSGAVELDALEAIHPGELQRLLSEAIDPWFDKTIEAEFVRASRAAESVVTEALADAISPITPSVDEIETRIEAVMTRHAALRDELAPLVSELEELQEDLRNAVQNLDVDLPDRPESRLPDPPNADWLYDSRRNYWEQLARYRKHQRIENDTESM